MSVKKILLNGNSSAWVVSGYRIVKELLADDNLSLSSNNSSGGYQGFVLPESLNENLLNLDPPRHTLLKKIALEVFSRNSVLDFTVQFEELVHSLIANLELVSESSVDLVSQYCLKLALHSVALYLGFSVSIIEEFYENTRLLLSSNIIKDERVQAAERMWRQIFNLAQNPSGAIREKIFPYVDEKIISDAEYQSLIFLSLWAGYENSSILLANTLVSLLTDEQSLWGELIYGGAMPSHVREELIRKNDGNIFSIRRFVKKEFIIENTLLQEGDTVLLSIRDSNLSHDIYGQHVSFGAGRHHCPGVYLARMQLELAIPTMVQAYPQMQLCEPVQYFLSQRIYTPEKIVVTIT